MKYSLIFSLCWTLILHGHVNAADAETLKNQLEILEAGISSTYFRSDIVAKGTFEFNNQLTLGELANPDSWVQMQFEISDLFKSPEAGITTVSVLVRGDKIEFSDWKISRAEAQNLRFQSRIEQVEKLNIAEEDINTLKNNNEITNSVHSQLLADLETAKLNALDRNLSIRLTVTSGHIAIKDVLISVDQEYIVFLTKDQASTTPLYRLDILSQGIYDSTEMAIIQNVLNGL